MKRIIVLLSIGVVLGLSLRTEGHDIITTKITFNREISRILYERCVTCHRDEGSAFSLMTYAEARPWAVAIKEEVLSRRMPPWGGIKGFGEFRNDQALTGEQLELITDWVEGGAPEGEPADLPPQPEFSEVSPNPIPEGALVLEGDFTLTRPFTVDGIFPEKINDDESAQIVAELPGGAVEPLVWLYEYRAAYAHPFLLRTPLDLPRGTFIRGVPPDSKIVLMPPSPASSDVTQSAPQ